MDFKHERKLRNLENKKKQFQNKDLKQTMKRWKKIDIQK